MFSSKSLVFVFVLLAALVDAIPLKHKHIRRSCSHHSAPAQSLVAVASSASSVYTSSASSASSVYTSSASSATSSSKSTSGSTSTSSSAESTSTGGSTVVPSSKLIAALFPVKIESGNSGWTTASQSINALPLSDETLNPTNVLKELAHPYVAAPDGKLGMKAFYPKGSYTLTREPKGGISFYAPGPDNVDLTTAKEATLGYSVFFEEGFGWQLGGKLPGLYGGDTAEDSVGCSGGSRSDACFSARLMWRTDGAGELYTYLPPYTNPEFAANKAVCDVAPKSDCNAEYGASVGRGAFTFVSGQWNTISQRVRLNDAGQANGELELFIGGRSVINVGGLILRDSADGRIRGIQMQTFFGGSEQDFASPKDQSAWFSDFTVAITETL
ncbi:polysaccharide lyase family 14 protein [Hygrophoropsis aurantiaca]|uniref:Polysaccharide lyase family 14 protein n=1 Tax=Hygrophoropsis aurantiaca TaxID=72124 RepID=A0ACB8AF42_9AGAM|nr:polysaccharide lyase family 14 protein [Hygrophoropsis aurantiaca]